MNKQPSVFGGACIIASVCVGAGMLGLPSAGAGAWTLWTCLVMLVTMIVMTISGWMLLEAYKRYDIRVSFDTVTHDMFGSGANLINNLAVYFVGGILLYAYITTAGMILPPLIGLNSKVSSILFVLIFGAFVWHSTRAVDRISVVLIIFMALSFIFSIFGLTKNINIPTLFDTGSNHPSYAPYALAMFPVALASFGYHHSAASMRAYYGEERKASRAILGGTLITLVFYIVWIVSIFGNMPREQFAPVIAAGGDLDVLLPALSSVIQSENVNHAIRAFSISSLTSSNSRTMLPGGQNPGSPPSSRRSSFRSFSPPASSSPSATRVRSPLSGRASCPRFWCANRAAGVMKASPRRAGCSWCGSFSALALPSPCCIF